MLKKAIETIKITSLVWLCLMIPLFVGLWFIDTSMEKNSAKCINTFLDDECAGLSKYIGLQFENTHKDIEHILCHTDNVDATDIEQSRLNIKDILTTYPQITEINIYNSIGKFVFSTGDEKHNPLDVASPLFKDMANKVVYRIEQQDNGEIIIKNYAKKSVEYDGELKEFFAECTVKWSVYERYMNELQDGAFKRMIYIVSPDCGRYVSMNFLPKNMKYNKKTITALGLHLVKKLSSIKDGVSNINIESNEFMLCKKAVNTSEHFVGNKFFIIVVAGEDTIESMGDSLFGDAQLIIIIMMIMWLILCLLFSRFHNKMKEKLEISTAISESTPLAIAIFKVSDGSIMRINLSAMNLFRIEQETIPSINIWDLFMYDDDRDYILNAANSRINVLNYEVLAQSFGGGSFWSICSASPLDIDGHLHVVLAVLDINRRKEIEKKLANNAALLEEQIAERTADLEQKAQELEDSNSLLEKAKSVADEANNAKSKFLTNMSNELKTPINAIIGYSEILQEEALDRKDSVSADDLRKILGSAKHLLSLIDEILDLSKIEAGKTQLFFENIEIQNILKDVEALTMPLITEHDNSLFVECSKDIGSMYTDSTKLRQCLLNLLSNAAKFTEFGKITIRISAMVKSGIDYIDFSVIDTGIGIDSERIKTIFDSFQNTENGKSGAGLGLSLTKKYVEYLGGSISVESEPSAGSKFSMKIPRLSTVESNEFIEVKNQKQDEEVMEEFREDSFGRKSDIE